MRPVVLFILCCLPMLSPAGARAADSLDTCTFFIDSLPVVITSQGTWCLRQDVATPITSGFAIDVEANNVTIDCNGYKIGGLAGGLSTEARAIVNVERRNTTVRGCTVRGFLQAIVLGEGGGHLVEDNRIEGATGGGILIIADGSMVRRNLVIDTGGSPLDVGVTIGIAGHRQVHIVDNVVDGVDGADNAIGIRVWDNSGSVSGNRVSGVIADTGYIHAIQGIAGGRSIIRDNDVVGLGTPVEWGIHCDDDGITTTGNVVSGFANGIAACESIGDIVNTNVVD